MSAAEHTPHTCPDARRRTACLTAAPPPKVSGCTRTHAVVLTNGKPCDAHPAKPCSPSVRRQERHFPAGPAAFHASAGGRALPFRLRLAVQHPQAHQDQQHAAQCIAVSGGISRQPPPAALQPLYRDGGRDEGCRPLYAYHAARKQCRWKLSILAESAKRSRNPLPCITPPFGKAPVVRWPGRDLVRGGRQKLRHVV